MELRVQNFGLPSVGQRLGLGSRVCHAKSTNPQPYTSPKLGDPHLDLNRICFLQGRQETAQQGKIKLSRLLHATFFGLFLFLAGILIIAGLARL